MASIARRSNPKVAPRGMSLSALLDIPQPVSPFQLKIEASLWASRIEADAKVERPCRRQLGSSAGNDVAVPFYATCCPPKYHPMAGGAGATTIAASIAPNSGSPRAAMCSILMPGTRLDVLMQSLAAFE